MDKMLFDQAEGLRRMLASSRPRIFSFLSATSSQEKGNMLVNLGASLARAGQSVLVLDAGMVRKGVAEHLSLMPSATVMHVAKNTAALDDAILPTPQGFALSVLGKSGVRQSLKRQPKVMQRAEAIIDLFAKQYDVLIVDAMLDEAGMLPLQSLSGGSLIVQVSDNAESIKAAYSTIKRLNAELGRMPFSILVTGTTEERAKVVFQNMEKAASRYLAVPLTSIGYVPEDDHVNRAARLGRTVIDAFPRAGASLAFRKLAENFLYGAGVSESNLAMASGTRNFTA